MHIVIGFFHRPDFKTYNLFCSLESQFVPVKFIVSWDEQIVDKAFNFGKFKDLTEIDKSELIATFSRLFSVEANYLRKEAENYKPLYKILLSMYCRKIIGIDYCIMTDNDIFFFEPIPEINQLSNLKTPFLIQDVGGPYQIPDISKFIMNYFGRNDKLVIPNKGKGYNVGFCGLDLTMFDLFDDQSFNRFIEMLSPIDVWWKEQAFIGSMIFAFSKNVHTFEHQRYFFLCNNDPRYRMRSKIFHCICTSDKSQVDQFYKQGKSSLYSVAFNWLIGGIWSIVILVRRLVSFFYRRLFKRNEPGANRYRHLLNYLGQTYCEKILEIGVWRGDTSRLMILNSKNKQVEYHGIDVFETSTSDLVKKEVSLVADTMNSVLKRLKKISQSVYLYKGYSTDVFEPIRIKGIKFDCIWIDGGHSYETVKFDFEHYSQLLQKNGVIFIDDYSKDSHLPDVKKYVDTELLNNIKYDVTIHDQWFDNYRGYDYKVVSVKFRQ